MIDIKNKWALLTGSSRGIGFEIALYLAKRGCNLMLHSRKKEHTEKVYREVIKLGVKSVVIEADLEDPASVVSLLSEIDKLGMTVDFVFNNAGVQTPYKKEYTHTPVKDFNKCFQVNTIAPMMISYHFLMKMVERGFGRVINTTSGIQYEPEQAAYSGSKAALDKCTFDLASKYNGTDVMINLVDPGWCRTDMGGKYAPNDVKDALPGVVLGAFMDDRKSGRIIRAQAYRGMNLEKAVLKLTNVD